MPQKQPATAASTSLKLALKQNEAIQDTVEQSAVELLVINAVLKQEVPAHVQTGEVAQALQKTDELEGRIQTSADELTQVNEALKQEISERADLERQLAATQAELTRAQGRSHSDSQEMMQGPAAMQ